MTALTVWLVCVVIVLIGWGPFTIKNEPTKRDKCIAFVVLIGISPLILFLYILMKIKDLFNWFFDGLWTS